MPAPSSYLEKIKAGVLLARRSLKRKERRQNLSVYTHVEERQERKKEEKGDQKEEEEEMKCGGVHFVSIL